MEAAPKFATSVRVVPGRRGAKRLVIDPIALHALAKHAPGETKLARGLAYMAGRVFQGLDDHLIFDGMQLGFQLTPKLVPLSCEVCSDGGNS